MSDSGSSMSDSSTRMLERRVSNNRADLNGDQQMNYFLSWFNNWSDLQKSDFVPVLADKMGQSSVNGVTNHFSSLDVKSSRPPSLYLCQVKLFTDWFSGWSDDQKNYLVLRLRALDSEFFRKYEDHLQNPDKPSPKDYFDPGIPEEYVMAHNRNREAGDYRQHGQLHGDDDEEDNEDSLKKYSASSSLSPVSEEL